MHLFSYKIFAEAWCVTEVTNRIAPMTNQEHVAENKPLIASTVAEDDRVGFLPQYYRRLFMAAESLTYVFADRFIQGYSGGHWNYFTVDNGAFFMAPSVSEQVHLVVAENYTSEHMSAEAAGVVITLYVLNYLTHARIPKADVERFIDFYYKLREYAADHAESPAIFTAID